MMTAVEHRFMLVNQLLSLIKWLTGNGSSYLARDMRRFARGIGLVPRMKPLDSPQSNGVAEPFVRILKRQCARVSVLLDARFVPRYLPL